MRARVFPFNAQRKAAEPVITMSILLRDYGLRPNELAVFARIASFATGERNGGWCIESASEMAAALGISAWAVGRTLAFLDLANLIQTGKIKGTNRAAYRPRPVAKWMDIDDLPVYRNVIYGRPKTKGTQSQAASNVLAFPGESAGRPKRAC